MAAALAEMASSEDLKLLCCGTAKSALELAL
jgi:hypothetical protein